MHTRRRRAEAWQFEVRIMQDNTETRVSLSHDPMPIPAGSALAVVHSHDAKAFNGIPAAPALQLRLNSEELQGILQLGEIGGERPFFASAYAIIDEQLSDVFIGPS